MRVLDGIRVIELGTMITAPLAGMMLADLGAEVIKIERPEGDPFRSFRGGRYSPHFTAYNRNKKSVVLDLATEDGRAALRLLLDSADVMLENFRPGVLDRLGFGDAALQALNPRLIRCAITGFGAGGPYGGRPAFDAVASALAGVSSLFIDPEAPQVSGPTISDNVTGMYACYGVLGALHERHASGRGRRIDVNMLESAIAFIPDPFANQTLLGIKNEPKTRVATSQSFAARCQDGKLIAVHLSSPVKFWDALVAALRFPGLAADPRFGSRDLRVRNYETLAQELAKAFATRPRAEWVVALEAADVPFAPIQSIEEVFEDPQVQHLGTFYTLSHPTEGEIVGIHRPVRIDGERDIGPTPPPTLGEHTREVLAAIGCDDEMANRMLARTSESPPARTL